MRLAPYWKAAGSSRRCRVEDRHAHPPPHSIQGMSSYFWCRERHCWLWNTSCMFRIAGVGCTPPHFCLTSTLSNCIRKAADPPVCDWTLPGGENRNGARCILLNSTYLIVCEHAATDSSCKDCSQWWRYWPLSTSLPTRPHFYLPHDAPVAEICVCECECVCVKILQHLNDLNMRQVLAWVQSLVTVEYTVVS